MKKPIIKQLESLINICEKYRTEANSEYLDNLKSELELALNEVAGEAQDFEYLADTEHYNEMVA